MEKISIEELLTTEEIERDASEERASFEALMAAMESIQEDSYESQKAVEDECLDVMGWTRNEFNTEVVARDMKEEF